MILFCCSSSVNFVCFRYPFKVFQPEGGILEGVVFEGVEVTVAIVEVVVVVIVDGFIISSKASKLLRCLGC